MHGAVEYQPPGYEYIGPIGKGCFGNVIKLRRIRDDTIFACKEVSYANMSTKEKELLVSEVNLLRELNNINIVKYVDRHIDKLHGKIYIIMEYCSNGDLSAYIRKHRKSRTYIAEEVIWTVLVQILLALQYCHKKDPQVLHRDLKPSNVLLTDDDTVKLADFGLARVLKSGEIANTLVGTPLYMSPEQVNRQGYDVKSDVWSVGCMTYEMAALHPPFDADDRESLQEKIKEGKIEPLPNHYSNSLQQMVSAMLCMSHSNRATIDQLLETRVANSYAVEVRNQQYKKVEIKKIEQKTEQLKRWEEKLREKEKYLNQKEAELRQQFPMYF